MGRVYWSRETEEYNDFRANKSRIERIEQDLAFGSQLRKIVILNSIHFANRPSSESL